MPEVLIDARRTPPRVDRGVVSVPRFPGLGKWHGDCSFCHLQLQRYYPGFLDPYSAVYVQDIWERFELMHEVMRPKYRLLKAQN